jgi:glutaredoxin-related protein
MTRLLLSSDHIHVSIQSKVGGGHQSVVEEVIEAVDNNVVLVVGMRQNPVCKSVNKKLNDAGIHFKYLEYGSYLKDWKPRLAIKMWSGWPTFPMVFVNGTLVGGSHEVGKLIDSGEMQALITA